MKWRFKFRSEKKPPPATHPLSREAEDYYSEIGQQGNVLHRSDSTPCFPVNSTAFLTQQQYHQQCSSDVHHFQKTKRSPQNLYQIPYQLGRNYHNQNQQNIQSFVSGSSRISTSEVKADLLSPAVSNVSIRVTDSLPRLPRRSETFSQCQQNLYSSQVQPIQTANTVQIKRTETAPTSLCLSSPAEHQLATAESGCPPHQSLEIAANATSPVAFCPNCHTLVHPIPRRRPQIRTNPWVQCRSPSTPVSTTPASHMAITPNTDSGISENLGQSDTGSTSGAKHLFPLPPPPSIPPDYQDKHICPAKMLDKDENTSVISRLHQLSIDSYPNSPHRPSDLTKTFKEDDVDNSQSHKRRKKKKQRRKKSSASSFEASGAAKSENLLSPQNLENQSVERRHSLEGKPSSVRRHSTANIYHDYNPIPPQTSLMSISVNLSNRPLPKVHEDEVLAYSRPLQQHHEAAQVNFSRPSNLLNYSHHQYSSSAVKPFVSGVHTSLVGSLDSDDEMKKLRRQMRSKIDKLISDKRMLEVNLERAQRDWDDHQRDWAQHQRHPISGDWKLREEAHRLKADKLRTLVETYEHVKQEMSVLEASWQWLLDSHSSPPSINTSNIAPGYDYWHGQTYSNTFVSTLPRHL